MKSDNSKKRRKKYKNKLDYLYTCEKIFMVMVAGSGRLIRRIPEPLSLLLDPIPPPGFPLTLLFGLATNVGSGSFRKRFQTLI